MGEEIWAIMVGGSKIAWSQGQRRMRRGFRILERGFWRKRWICYPLSPFSKYNGRRERRRGKQIVIIMI